MAIERRMNLATGEIEEIEYEPAPVAPPEAVSMRQARLALLGAGVLDKIDAAISQIGGAAQIEWEYATEVRRDSPLIGALASVLGMTDAQIDALFIAAAAL